MSVEAPASTTQAPAVRIGPIMAALLMAMFVSMLTNTVVNTSLPVIVAELGGTQTTFTWVIISALLATTVSTLVWGKFADMFNRKNLFLGALILFSAASMVAGLADSPAMLIATRALQGVGAGGLMALSQIIMADVTSPRERGKYAGHFGAVTAIGTIGGPLLGGLITDTLNWRWNFYIAIPFAVAAIILIQRRLQLPPLQVASRKIDYLGIVLISSGASLLLIWVSLGGSMIEWFEPVGIAMSGGAALLLLAFVLWEAKAANPLVPLTLFKNRSFTLAVVASLSVGIAMFATAAYLSQYMQLARGATPTESGLMTSPMMVAFLVTSTIAGALVSRYGHWKPYLIAGAVLLLLGMLQLTQLQYNTPFPLVALAMVVLGTGMGMLMQNLVVVTQNVVAPNVIGVATSANNFFRNLAGTIAVSAMGAMLTNSVAAALAAGIPRLPEEMQVEAAQLLSSGQVPAIQSLPEELKILVESAYGSGIGEAFYLGIPLAIIGLIAVFFIPNIPLNNMSASEQAAADAAKIAAEQATAPESTITESAVPEAAIPGGTK